MTRTIKRIVILCVYLAIFLSIAGCMYWTNRPPASCFDGRQNQNEEGVDCGGVCAACEEPIKPEKMDITSTAVMRGGPGVYDVVAEVSNPNPLLGASRFYYTITLYDGSNQRVAQRAGTSLILPQQDRFVAELNISSSVEPKKVSMEISDVEWVRFENIVDPDFIVSGESYGKVQAGIDFAEAFGVVHNRSPYDFAAVDALVILRNEIGQPIAVNKTRIGAFRAFEQRDFRLNWTYPFDGVISDIDIDVEVDVYDSENFINASGIDVGDFTDQSNYR